MALSRAVVLLSIFVIDLTVACAPEPAPVRPVGRPYRTAEQRRADTTRLLSDLDAALASSPGYAPDTRGRIAFVHDYNGSFFLGDPGLRFESGPPRESDSSVVCDGWDRYVYYLRPGPIHKNGWDFISCGPNGIYEEGQGDDIVVGADVPGGIAAIASGGR